MKRKSTNLSRRPQTMQYSAFVKSLNDQTLLPGEFSKKEDGFSVQIQRKSDGSDWLTYCAKSGNPYTEASVDPGRFVEDDMRRQMALNPVKCLGDRAIFVAIERYFREKLSYLDPHSVEYNGRRGMILYVEFCVCDKTCAKGYDNLQALMCGLCVTADGEIDLENYDVTAIVFDVVFEGYPERSDPCYHARLECIGDAFNGFQPRLHTPFDPATFTDEYEPIVENGPLREYRSHTPWRLYSREAIIEALSEHEGFVMCSGRMPEEWFKVKPDRPVGLEIVGVANTIGPDFHGYDKLLLAAPSGDHNKVAVDMIDLYTVFADYTRAQQGKACVNPASIKRNSAGVIECTSSSTLRPMLSALFGRISQEGGRLIPPTVVGTSEIRVGNAYHVKCGSARSFHRYFRQMKFLEKPVAVTMSANQFWLVPSDPTEVHLQASRVLAVGFYGPEHFQNLPPMAHATLLDIATRRIDRNPRELFRLAGVNVAPFFDLPRMDGWLFLDE